MKKILTITILVFVLGFPLAYGHPFTEETVPPQSSNAPVGTTQVTVYYSEAVEIDFSALKVFDNTGTQIDNKDTKYFQGESSLIVTTSGRAITWMAVLGWPPRSRSTSAMPCPTPSPSSRPTRTATSPRRGRS